MDQQPYKSQKARSGRRRASRGLLRRHTNIDGVTVEEPFTFSLPSRNQNSYSSQAQTNLTNEDANDDTVGEGCYVTCTVQSRRYYGVLIDQAALKTASELYFQDEAASLDINRRMMTLKKQRVLQQKWPTTQVPNGHTGNTETQVGVKRSSPSSHTPENGRKKLLKTCDSDVSNGLKQIKSSTTQSSSASVVIPEVKYDDTQQVQKLRHVDPTRAGDKGGPGYRLLLATYANVLAAAEDSPEKAQIIFEACQSGGDFVGEYYYQYQIPETTLVARHAVHDAKEGIRSSSSFHTFLHNTILPPWFPLSNIMGHQSKILNMLQMKKSKKGGVDWNDDTETHTSAVSSSPTVQMAPRACFRIGVIGGGLSGLGCAVELLRLAEEERLNIEVTLLEARSRIGGRVMTDRVSFKTQDGSSFPVDLGAGWIHGIDENPLTDLAKEAKVDFLRHSEEVKMLSGGMKEVDRVIDNKMGKLFDNLLDDAAEECWNRGENVNKGDIRYQQAVRWYASVLDGTSSSFQTPQTKDVSNHRYSSDISIDHAIGIVTTKRKEVRNLSEQEHHLLHWNTKNTEYALGANICDLSMKFWDADERHAFEGDHVLLKQGYLRIPEILLQKCKRHNNFKTILDFPVGKIEYDRKSIAVPYPNKEGRSRQSISLSDTCRVTSRDGQTSHAFDFIVCTLPLGILKNSIDDPSLDKDLSTSTSAATSSSSSKVEFQPPLPSIKKDAINSVGFGILNKIYLQFPEAFWRKSGKREFFRETPYLGDEQNVFGNASGLNPHHYMFLDIGNIFGQGDDDPAILMTLVSGVEAVTTEQMSEPDLLLSVTNTLKHLFSDVDVPDPIVIKASRWGTDEYSRGSYTFLPPGATDQDYQILQSAINGNGDVFTVGDQEIMRLFFAGEHTTALHPSMAHGALLSGIRAAKEVIEVTCLKPKKDELMNFDRPIPVSLYRYKHHNDPVQCHLCRYSGSRTREGALLGFQKGGRQVLVHHNCAVYSPEVEIKDDQWKNVIKCVNRGRQLNCALCGKNGATIGCYVTACSRSFHFGCCEDTGWNFVKMGHFMCDSHREVDVPLTDSTDNTISIAYYRSKNPQAPVKCQLCSTMGDCSRRGRLLGFQRGSKQVLVHKNCARYSTNVNDLGGTYDDETDMFQNIFEAISRNKQCESCKKRGATVECSFCDVHYHFTCAQDTDWDFKANEDEFLCQSHRQESNSSSFASRKEDKGISSSETAPSGIIQHNLFCRGSKTVPQNAKKRPKEIPRSRKVSSAEAKADESEDEESNSDDDSSYKEQSEDESDEEKSVKDLKTSAELLQPFYIDPHIVDDEIGRTYIIHADILARRSSMDDLWNIRLAVHQPTAARSTNCCMYFEEHECKYGMKYGDIIISINGMKIGSAGMSNMVEVVNKIKKAVQLKIEVIRKPSS